MSSRTRSKVAKSGLCLAKALSLVPVGQAPTDCLVWQSLPLWHPQNIEPPSNKAPSWRLWDQFEHVLLTLGPVGKCVLSSSRAEEPDRYLSGNTRLRRHTLRSLQFAVLSSLGSVRPNSQHGTSNPPIWDTGKLYFKLGSKSNTAATTPVIQHVSIK